MIETFLTTTEIIIVIPEYNRIFDRGFKLTPRIKVHIDKYPIESLVDSGSQVTIVTSSVVINLKLKLL